MKRIELQCKVRRCNGFRCLGPRELWLIQWARPTRGPWQQSLWKLNHCEEEEGERGDFGNERVVSECGPGAPNADVGVLHMRLRSHLKPLRSMKLVGRSRFARLRSKLLKYQSRSLPHPSQVRNALLFMNCSCTVHALFMHCKVERPVTVSHP